MKQPSVVPNAFQFSDHFSRSFLSARSLTAKCVSPVIACYNLPISPQIRGDAFSRNGEIADGGDTSSPGFRSAKFCFHFNIECSTLTAIVPFVIVSIVVY